MESPTGYIGTVGAGEIYRFREKGAEAVFRFKQYFGWASVQDEGIASATGKCCLPQEANPLKRSFRETVNLERLALHEGVEKRQGQRKAN
jgi:hypothetical protein